jgi:DNA polymerase-3 subunit delta
MSKDRSVYLLLGPEEGEKDRFVQALRKELAAGGGEEPEVHRFYPFDTKMADVLSVLRNGSLFAGRRLVILSCLEQVAGREEQKQLAEYCARPARDATLLLLSTEIKAPAAIEKAVPAENRKIFWELFDNQKTGWIANFFRKRQITLSPEATTLLLEMVENNTRQLEATCSQLALFFGPGARIEPEDIERTLAHTKEENVFTLFDRLAGRDLVAALEVLQKILLSREAEPIQIMAGLLAQFRRLRMLKLLLAERYSLEEAFGRTGIRSKRLQKIYQEAHRRYSLEELESIVVLIGEFDLRLRAARTGLDSFLLKVFLYYLVVRGGQGAWKSAG